MHPHHVLSLTITALCALLMGSTTANAGQQTPSAKVIVAAPSSGEPGVFSSPDLKGPDLLTPDVASPFILSQKPAFTNATPTSPLMTTPSVSANSVDKPLAATQPAAMSAPGVQAPNPITIPAMDPMSAGAPRFTTGHDVAVEVEHMNHVHDSHPAKTHGNLLPGASTDGARNPKAQDIKTTSREPTSVLEIPVSPIPTENVPTGHMPGFDGDGCKPGGDVTQLLSPACLNSLRDNLHSAHEPSLQQNTANPAILAQVTQCAMVIFNAAGIASAPAAFQTSNVQQCVATASSLSYGVPGMSNITAVDPQWGVVSVTCHRPGPDGHTLTCEAQE